MVTSAGARSLWAATKLHVWPERYVLVSLPTRQVGEAAELVAKSAGAFVACVLERDELSVTVKEELFESASLRAPMAGPFRVITLDVNVDLDVSGYLAPAADRLAAAGVPIVPQCGFLKDHLLVHERDLERARTILEALISECRESS